jgi:hypothetical protein
MFLAGIGIGDGTTLNGAQPRPLRAIGPTTIPHRGEPIATGVAIASRLKAEFLKKNDLTRSLQSRKSRPRETIEYEDDKGRWHPEAASGRDRSHTIIKDKD